MGRLTEKVFGSAQIIKCGNDLCSETCEEYTCKTCPISQAIDKLAEYEDAEEQGLLLRLPCPIGTKAFYIMYGKSGWFISDYEFEVIDLLDFGNRIFLTREEAEQALKQMGE